MNQSELKLLSEDHPILFYDGVCHLCDGFVNWLIPKDKKEAFYYCPLQSDIGQEVRQALNLGEAINTVLLYHRGKWYYKSDVSIQIVNILGGPWRILSIAQYVPKKLRDKIYDWVASNRYRWFGQAEQCIVPEASLSKRFIL